MCKCPSHSSSDVQLEAPTLVPRSGIAEYELGPDLEEGGRHLGKDKEEERTKVGKREKERNGNIQEKKKKAQN